MYHLETETSSVSDVLDIAEAPRGILNALPCDAPVQSLLDICDFVVVLGGGEALFHEIKICGEAIAKKKLLWVSGASEVAAGGAAQVGCPDVKGCAAQLTRWLTNTGDGGSSGEVLLDRTIAEGAGFDQVINSLRSKGEQLAESQRLRIGESTDNPQTNAIDFQSVALIVKNDINDAVSAEDLGGRGATGECDDPTSTLSFAEMSLSNFSAPSEECHAGEDAYEVLDQIPPWSVACTASEFDERQE